MLKKRLLASAMASIMAVSTLGVASMAEDTAVTTTTEVTAVKSKADLKALVDSYGTKFREETIYNYATSTGIAMLNALEFGDNVLADATSEEADFTAAYLMITNVAKDLVIYTAADVKALVAKCKPVYDTENILNPEIADNIYDTAYFAAFAADYDYASTLSATESQIITDCYVELNNSYNTLLGKKLTTVTKAQFAALDKQMNAILVKRNKYEDWRRGTAVVDAGGYTATVTGYQLWPSVVPLTWGNLFETTQANYSSQDWVNFYMFGYWQPQAQAAYDNFANFAKTGKTTDTVLVDTYTKAKKAADTVDAFTTDAYNTARKATVDSLIAEYKERMVEKWAFTGANAGAAETVASTYTITGVINDIITRLNPGVLADDTAVAVAAAAAATAAADLLAAQNAVTTAVANLKTLAQAAETANLTAETTAASNAADAVVDAATAALALTAATAAVTANSTVDTLATEAAAQTVVTAYATLATETADNTAAAAALATATATYTTANNAAYTTLFGTATKATTMKLASTAPTFYVTYNETTGAIAAVSTAVPATGTKYRTYKAGTTIKLYEYVDFKSAVMAGTYVGIPQATNLSMEAALQASYDYIDANYTGLMATYSDGTVAKDGTYTETGTAAEWAVIYRLLKYAIIDNFPAADATYSLEQMYQALQDSYKADTYESAVFADELKGVVAIRKLAADFYKKAKQMTNYKIDTVIDDVAYTYEGKTYETDGLTSTILYKALVWGGGSANITTNDDENLAPKNEPATLSSVTAFVNKLAKYPYSYGEIYDLIGEASELADEKNADATFKGLIDTLAKALSVCEANPNDADGTNAWDDSRLLQPTNRVTKYDPWVAQYYAPHGAVISAYEALKTAITALEAKADVVLGDADGDGVVTAKDALLVLKAATGVEVTITKEAADFNADGVVDVRDALAILKAAVAV